MRKTKVGIFPHRFDDATTATYEEIINNSTESV